MIEQCIEPRFEPLSILDLETITVNEYLVGDNGDKRVKVIKFNNPVIEDGKLVKKIAGEFLGFLKEGNLNYDPESVYCRNFENVQWASSLLIGKAINFNELHKTYHERPLSFCSMREGPSDTLRFLGMRKHFKIYETESAFLNSL